MATAMICSTLTLLVIGWVLFINSNDLKVFERELQEDSDHSFDDHRPGEPAFSREQEQ